MHDPATPRMTDRDLADLAKPPQAPALTAALAPLAAAHAARSSYVIGQLGLSLDGRIATTSGESRYINGQDALRHLHRLRAMVDAVIVGAGTVTEDDPQLNVRHCAGTDPARIVIDPNGRVGPDARLWSATGARRVVVGGAVDLPGDVERITPPPGPLPAGWILHQLAALGLKRVLVEGGANTLGRFLDAGALDGLHLLYGRVILGSGKPGLDLAPLGSLKDALRPRTDTHVFDDGDFLVACHFDRLAQD
jgi:riboflavin-specific deaminase-like protein